MTIEKGIRKTGSGWQVYVRRKGEFLSKHFKPDTPLVDLRRWRNEQHARTTLNLPALADAGSLRADADSYLGLVTHLTSYKDRKYRIEQWVTALGPETPRSAITSVEIRRALETWRTSGLSLASLNLRRTALMHLYSVLDGKSGKNPVRDVPRYTEPQQQWHLPTWKDAEKAITAVSRDRLNGSRVRLAVLLWTGLPSAQLKRLTAEDVNLKAGTMRVPGRLKGKGTKAAMLPLLPQAVTAFRQLARADAWGAFSNSSLHKALLKGCTRAKVPAFRVYDLRHLFGTTLATVVKDDRVIAELLQHSDLSLTKRYTEQSVNPRVSAALHALHAFAPQMQKSGKTRRTRKQRKHR